MLKGNVLFKGAKQRERKGEKTMNESNMVRVTVKGFSHQHGCDPIASNNILQHMVKSGAGKIVDKIKKDGAKGKPANVFEIPATWSITTTDMIEVPVVTAETASAESTEKTEKDEVPA